MTAKRNGDLFEACFVTYLHDIKVKPMDSQTTVKATKLLAYEVKELDLYKLVKPKIFRFLATTPIATISTKSFHIDSYKLTSTNDGKYGDAADIIIYGRRRVYNDDTYTDHPHELAISLKHNNSFVKHQSPASLMAQLGVEDESLIQSYKSAYTEIIGHYYGLFTCDDESTIYRFKDQTHDDKDDLYGDINELYCEYINDNQDCANQYMRFIMSTPPRVEGVSRYIIKYSNAKLTVYDCNRPLACTHMLAEILVKPNNKFQNNTVELTFYHNQEIIVRLELRIHNSATNVTRNLPLKYSTTIINMNTFYKHIVI